MIVLVLALTACGEDRVRTVGQLPESVDQGNAQLLPEQPVNNDSNVAQLEEEQETLEVALVEAIENNDDELAEDIADDLTDIAVEIDNAKKGPKCEKGKKVGNKFCN